MYYLLNKQKLLLLFGLCLWRFARNLCTAQPTMLAFMFKDCELNGIFNTFTGRTHWTYHAFKNLSTNMKTSQQDRNYILCFNSCVCLFEVMYVASWMEIHLCPLETKILYCSVESFRKILKACICLLKRNF